VQQHFKIAPEETVELQPELDGGDRWLRLIDDPVTAILPWVAMSYAIDPLGFTGGMAVGLILSLALVVISRARGDQAKVLELADVALFGAMVLLGLVSGGLLIGWFTDHADMVSNLGLALIAFISLAVGRPFTAEYTKVRLSHLSVSMHQGLNRTATLAWGTAFLAASAVTWFGEWVLDAPNNLWTGWILQTLPLVWAFLYIRWYDLRALATVEGSESIARSGWVLLRDCSFWTAICGVVSFAFGYPGRELAWSFIAAGALGMVCASTVVMVRGSAGRPLAQSR
jgi:hypothetical protein